MSDLTLRPAAPADLPDLAELYLATRAAAVPAMPAIVHSADRVRAFIGDWSLTGAHAREVWVAEDDLGLAGFAVLKDDWLDSLYVGPDRQGSGIGTMLLDVVKSLRPRGFALWVFASNASARGFYHRQGLIELEHNDGSGNEEGSPDVRMAWPGSDPLDYLRREVDGVDAGLAELLARRFALTAAIQGEKLRAGLGAGRESRDPEREGEIVAQMARHAPGLPVERVAPIMAAVIREGLTAWESEHAS